MHCYRQGLQPLEEVLRKSYKLQIPTKNLNLGFGQHDLEGSKELTMGRQGLTFIIDRHRLSVGCKVDATGFRKWRTCQQLPEHVRNWTWFCLVISSRQA
jgi:hypothetical protein